MPDAGAITDEILSLLSERDCRIAGLLLESYEEGKPDEDFYRRAGKSPSRFIRQYFEFDRRVRNTKTRWLNKKLDRPLDTDCIFFEDEADPDPDEQKTVSGILAGNDILGREHALDAMAWKKVDGLTGLDILDLDLILGFLVKLKMAARWSALDPGRGRELFRKIVSDIRKNR